MALRLWSIRFLLNMAHIEEEVVKGGIGIREGLIKIVARSNAETLAWVMLRQKLVDAEDEGESEEELAR